MKTGIWGLDLLLGGGLRLVKRFEEVPPSAVLLIRGAPGTGKTLFASQLAVVLSKEMIADIAYACVELLPTELREQWVSFPRSTPFFSAPFTDEINAQTAPSVFAGILELGASGDEPARLEGALMGFIAHLRSIGRSPGVLVIDSLSEGYNLGSSLKRPTVDSICKLAVSEGISVVLIEETSDYSASHWSFAADTVFELSLEKDIKGGLQRSVTIRKHRFGATEPGPHQLEFLPSKGLDVLPRASSYATPLVRGQLLNKTPEQFWNGTKHTWAVTELENSSWREFRKSVVFVCGVGEPFVRQAAFLLGRVEPRKPGESYQDLIVEFGEVPTSGALLKCTPYTTAEEILAEVFVFLQRDLQVRRMIVGDFRALRNFQHREEILRAVGVLVRYLRYWKIPLICFESTAPRNVSTALRQCRLKIYAPMSGADGTVRRGFKLAAVLGSVKGCALRAVFDALD